GRARHRRRRGGRRQDAARARALGAARRRGSRAATPHRPLPALRARDHLLAARRDPQEHLGILESDDPERVRAQLAGREILGLTRGLDVAGDLHPLAARDRLQEAWVELLEELSAERAIVVLVEDLHWAEDPLLDLLEHLVRRVRGPLLLIGTGRPELLDRRPGFARGSGAADVVPLEPLDPGAAGE